MKILFLNSTIPNYVTDGLFHGLRSIPGITVVDVPRLDYMYCDASMPALAKTGSKGNTLYKLLQDVPEIKGNRTFWYENINEYDLIIVSDIFHQCDLFHSIYNKLHRSKKSKLCIVDGYDDVAMFPFFNISYNLRIRPWSYLYKTRRVQYFKREYQNAASLFGFSKERFPFYNKIFSRFFKRPGTVYPISMSIPQIHIKYIPFKNKVNDFVAYNVDKDLNDLFADRRIAELGKWQPAFNDQFEYFSNIEKSKFGITSKRAGWDCLRHYEYAAKGTILCFKNLANKDLLCAPFELDETNCIPYFNKEDLLRKIRSKSIMELESIQEQQYKWIEKYTTKKVALRFLDNLLSN